jgi:hypothetical protein
MPNDTERRVVTKTVTKTPVTSPGELLKVKLGNVGKYDYLRMFFGGPDGETPIELVLHRPVGITKLDDDEWVISSPKDYALLLKRENNPGEKGLRVKRDAHKKTLAVAEGLIKTSGTDDVILLPSGKNRNEFLLPFKEKVKKLVRDNNKLISDWKKMDVNRRALSPPSKVSFNKELQKELRLVPEDPDAVAELKFSAFMAEKTTIEAAETQFPDRYETLGGTTADAKQKAVPWAKGLQRGQLQQEFAKWLELLMVGDPLGMFQEPTEPEESDESDTPPVGKTKA